MHFSILVFALGLISSVFAAQLTQVTGFGDNPTNVGMYVYKPDIVASDPAVIIAIHYCGGTAQAYYSGTQYANLADTYGFIVIYPSSPNSGGCWDVSTDATLTHNGGGDSLGIASMARYAISAYGTDANKTYMTGTSSGAMMVNVLAGAYPDLFQAGTAYSGVPFGCFAGASSWNTQCALGELIKTDAAWGDEVRAAYPGYSGARPKLKLWHGTADTILYYQNLVETNKQWSNVFGISFSYNETDTPESGYTEMIFGDGTQYIAESALGVGHTVPVHETDDLAWFGIA